MHNPYGSTHNAPTSRSDSFTIKEANILGRYRANALLRFRDYEAYFCTGCRNVYGVYCPNCKTRSNNRHMPDADNPFAPSDYVDRWDGFNWIKVQCRKCDYEFKVIVR